MRCDVSFPFPPDLQLSQLVEAGDPFRYGSQATRDEGQALQLGHAQNMLRELGQERRRERPPSFAVRTYTSNTPEPGQAQSPTYVCPGVDGDVSVHLF